MRVSAMTLSSSFYNHCTELRVIYMVKLNILPTNPSGLCYVSNEDIQGTELRVIYMAKLNILPSHEGLCDDSSVIGYNHSKS